jgi:hypothetical protein
MRQTLLFSARSNNLPSGNRKRPAELSFFRLVKYFAAGKWKTCGRPSPFPSSQMICRPKIENIRQTFPFSTWSNLLPSGHRNRPVELPVFRPVKYFVDRKNKTYGGPFPFPGNGILFQRNLHNAALLRARQGGAFLVQRKGGSSIPSGLGVTETATQPPYSLQRSSKRDPSQPIGPFRSLAGAPN